MDREQQIIRDAQKNPEAFGAIFDAHYDRIYAYAMHRIGDPDLATDITAETFTKALDGISRFRFQGVPISSWLYRIAGNEIKMHFRRSNNRRSVRLLSLIDDGFDVEDASFVEEREAIAEKEGRDASLIALRRALASLPDLYQDAVALRHIEGKTSAEVAEILGKNEGTVRSIISRGVSMLRESMLVQHGTHSGIMDKRRGNDGKYHDI